MKTKEEVNVQGKPVFYAVLYNSMRKAALDCGYALALHGSLHSDMDLMAMPWVEECKTPDELILALDECVGNTVWKDFQWKHKEVRSHGRICYTISIMGDWHIDISVMPTRYGWTINPKLIIK